MSIAPATGCLFGAYAAQPTDSTYTQLEATVTALETAIGRTLKVDQHFLPWGNSQTGTMTLCIWDNSHGRVPLITQGPVNVDDVLSGIHDAYINSVANSVKALGFPILLRWFAEMDGVKYQPGQPPPYGGMVSSAANYVAAWNHVRTLWSVAGATNVEWVWCPNASGFNSGGHALDYFPGNTAVDWIGGDGYDWTGLQHFSDIFGALATLPTTKPLMIGETGAHPGAQPMLCSEAQTYLHAHHKVKAFVYFDALSGTDEWRLDAAGTTAFAAMGADTYFNP